MAGPAAGLRLLLVFTDAIVMMIREGQVLYGMRIYPEGKAGMS